jgi:REP element-mobilizing transposase RayT
VRSFRSTPAAAQLALPLRGPKRPRRRRGPGRPRIHTRDPGPHRRRARITRHQPLHITLRTVPEARALRRRDAYRAVQLALYTTFKRGDFRICAISLQDGHIHLVVEASDYLALARGMQGFQISAARHLNRALSRRRPVPRRGQVFADRYHARVQRSPRQMRHTLGYVLCNWRKHGGDRHHASETRLDPYSSAPLFDGFRHRRVPDFIRGPLELLPVALPHSWLLSTGWRKHGLLDPDERPGGRP